MDTKQQIHVARQTMVGDLRDCVLDIIRDRRYTGKAWKDMTEQEQRDVSEMVVERVMDAVIRCADIISADGEKHIKGVLEQVTVKDGFKAVFKCSKEHPLRHELVDAQGSAILVVLRDVEQYMGTGEEVQIDKDQHELPVEAGEDQYAD